MNFVNKVSMGSVGGLYLGRNIFYNMDKDNTFRSQAFGETFPWSAGYQSTGYIRNPRNKTKPTRDKAKKIRTRTETSDRLRKTFMGTLIAGIFLMIFASVKTGLAIIIGGLLVWLIWGSPFKSHQESKKGPSSSALKEKSF